MIRLQRLSDQPILRPRPENPWEAAAVFNCAAILANGLVHLIYRATDITSNGDQGVYINSLGYAVSADGLHFNRLQQPILKNDAEQELRGPEDPRIVEIDGVFYMMYTGYGGRFPGDYRICLASSQNLIDWRRHGVVLHEQNKDASLFPERIAGRYIMFHRRGVGIWLAYSDDLQRWYGHRSIMQPIAGSSWENEKIGIAGPPIKTDEGWLLIYHGVSGHKRYCLGAALLDLHDPSQVLARQAEPILEPELEWEINGYVPNVVFSCGQAIVDGKLYIYYGGADTAVGVATLDQRDITFE